MQCTIHAQNKTKVVIFKIVIDILKNVNDIPIHKPYEVKQDDPGGLRLCSTRIRLYFCLTLALYP